MKLIHGENPLLSSDLESVRVLANRPETSSFLVRLGFSSKLSRNQLLDKGRIILEEISRRITQHDCNPSYTLNY